MNTGSKGKYSTIGEDRTIVSSLELNDPLEYYEYQENRSSSWFYASLTAGVLYGCLPITLGESSFYGLRA